MITDIFKYFSSKTTLGNIYYFADKVNGHFVIKQGAEDYKLFPLEENYGFVYINSKEYNKLGINEKYFMTFYYFYESTNDDKITKLQDIEKNLNILKQKADGFQLLKSNINNDEILQDFIHENIAGSSERKMIKVEFYLLIGKGDCV